MAAVAVSGGRPLVSAFVLVFALSVSLRESTVAGNAVADLLEEYLENRENGDDVAETRAVDNGYEVDGYEVDGYEYEPRGEGDVYNYEGYAGDAEEETYALGAEEENEVQEEYAGYGYDDDLGQRGDYYGDVDEFEDREENQYQYNYAENNYGDEADEERNAEDVGYNDGYEEVDDLDAQAYDDEGYGDHGIGYERFVYANDAMNNEQAADVVPDVAANDVETMYNPSYGNEVAEQELDTYGNDGDGDAYPEQEPEYYGEGNEVAMQGDYSDELEEEGRDFGSQETRVATLRDILRGLDLDERGNCKTCNRRPGGGGGARCS